MSYYLALYFIDGALHRAQRSADTQSGGDSVNTSSFPYIEVLRGRDGRDGRDGVPGPHGLQGQKGGQGVARPRSSCPSVSGTTLVYAGRAGGTWWQHKGGAANYLCMPDDPDYLRYTSGVQGHSYVYGAEYQSHHGPPKLFTTTMSPVLCATLQQGWQSP